MPTSWSSDGGRTWSALEKSGLYAVNSGSDAVTLQDGRHVLVYNHRDRPGGSPENYRPETLTGIKDAPTGPRARWPLVVSVSRDGVAWKQALTLEDAPHPPRLRLSGGDPDARRPDPRHVHVRSPDDQARGDRSGAPLTSSRDGGSVAQRNVRPTAR